MRLVDSQNSEDTGRQCDMGIIMFIFSTLRSQVQNYEYRLE